MRLNVFMLKSQNIMQAWGYNRYNLYYTWFLMKMLLFTALSRNCITKRKLKDLQQIILPKKCYDPESSLWLHSKYDDPIKYFSFYENYILKKNLCDISI